MPVYRKLDDAHPVRTFRDVERGGLSSLSRACGLPVSRRSILGTLAAGLLRGPFVIARPAPKFMLSTFTADVTPPLGHPLMGGGIAPAAEIVDPLYARGFVLSGAGKPVVLAAIDWCEIRNEAFDHWRVALADAAGIEPRRVLITTLHQHDTPIADLGAQRLLDARHAPGKICDLDFHGRAVRDVARAVRQSIDRNALRGVRVAGRGLALGESVPARGAAARRGRPGRWTDRRTGSIA
jgi:hypothetical protein